MRIDASIGDRGLASLQFCIVITADRADLRRYYYALNFLIIMIIRLALQCR